MEYRLTRIPERLWYECRIKGLQSMPRLQMRDLILRLLGMWLAGEITIKGQIDMEGWKDEQIRD